MLFHVTKIANQPLLATKTTILKIDRLDQTINPHLLDSTLFSPIFNMQYKI